MFGYNDSGVVQTTYKSQFTSRDKLSGCAERPIYALERSLEDGFGGAKIASGGAKND